MVKPYHCTFAVKSLLLWLISSIGAYTYMNVKFCEKSFVVYFEAQSENFCLPPV